MYLLLTFIITFYFYAEEANRFQQKFNIIALAWLPVFFVYFIVSATQYDVGTDYFTYRDYYNHPEQLELYFRKGEYLFYYLYKLGVYLNIGQQYIFYTVSLFNSIVLFFAFYKLRKAGFKMWIVFFLFMVVTGLYNNQMNGLRNYMGIMCFPLIAIYAVEKKFIKSAILNILATLCHFSSIFSLIIYPFVYINRLSRYKLFLCFLVLPAAYYLMVQFLPILVDALIPRYSPYLNSDYAKGISIVNFLSKLYYLPLFICFWAAYLERPVFFSQEKSKYEKYLSIGITIWVFTYWIIICSLYYGFMFRIQSAFIFFYIFPIYYLINYLNNKHKWWGSLIVLVYCALPYILKTTLLADGEYLYKNYIFN